MVDEATEVGKGAEAFLFLVDVVTEVGKGAEALLLLAVVVLAAAHAKAPNPTSTSLIHLRSLHLHERSRNSWVMNKMAMQLKTRESRSNYPLAHLCL